MDRTQRKGHDHTGLKGWQIALVAIVIAVILSAIAIFGARMVDEEDAPGGADETFVEPGDRRQ